MDEHFTMYGVRMPDDWTGAPYKLAMARYNLPMVAQHIYQCMEPARGENLYERMRALPAYPGDDYFMSGVLTATRLNKLVPLIKATPGRIKTTAGLIFCDKLAVLSYCLANKNYTDADAIAEYLGPFAFMPWIAPADYAERAERDQNPGTFIDALVGLPITEEEAPGDEQDTTLFNTWPVIPRVHDDVACNQIDGALIINEDTSVDVYGCANKFPHAKGFDALLPHVDAKFPWLGRLAPHALWNGSGNNFKDEVWRILNHACFVEEHS